MSTTTKQIAAQKIESQIDGLARDDLVEVYNEVFPNVPVSMDQNVENERLSTEIKQRIEEGLEIEEIIDLWNVLFPEHKNVWYDDEAMLIRFNEEPERVESPE